MHSMASARLIMYTLRFTAREAWRGMARKRGSSGVERGGVGLYATSMHGNVVLPIVNREGGVV